MAPWKPARRWKPLRWRFSVLPPPPGSTLTSPHRRESADDLIFTGIKKKSSIGSSLLYLALISFTCCSPFSFLPRDFFFLTLHLSFSVHFHMFSFSLSRAALLRLRFPLGGVSPRRGTKPKNPHDTASAPYHILTGVSEHRRLSLTLTHTCTHTRPRTHAHTSITLSVCINSSL